MAERKRVLLADDHQLVRAGLRLLIDGLPDFEVVAEVTDGIEAVEAARKLHPDVALLDISKAAIPARSRTSCTSASRRSKPIAPS